MRSLSCVLVLAAACSSPPTTAVVTVSIMPGEITPSAITANLFGVHGIAATQALPMTVLPARLVVKLPESAQPVRLVLDGPVSRDRQEGFVIFMPVSGQQVLEAVQLSTQTQDRDRDGVPDGADNCVDTPNADQIDTVGDGVGDACRNPDMNPGPVDLGPTPPLMVTGQVQATSPAGGGVTSLPVQIPVSVSQGDFMVLSVYVDAPRSLSPLAGWTLISDRTVAAHNYYAAFYSRPATVSDPGTTVMLTVASAVPAISATLVAYANVSSTSPYELPAPSATEITGTSSGGSLQFTAPPITTNRSGDTQFVSIVYHQVAPAFAGLWTPPAGCRTLAQTSFIGTFDISQQSAGAQSAVTASVLESGNFDGSTPDNDAVTLELAFPHFFGGG